MSYESDKIPWRSFIPVLMSRIATAAVVGYVYPFMPFMLGGFGLNAKEVSFYTGLIDSLTMAIEGIFAIPMARISDVYGRRPVLMGSLASITILSATLGLSQGLHGVLFVRVLCGINGIQSVTRTYIAELSNARTRLKMFSVFIPCFAVGMSTSTMISGYLAKPEGRLSVFGDMAIFKAHPYLLPSLATSMFPAVAWIACVFALPETLIRSEVSSGGQSSWETVRESLRNRDIRRLLVVFFVNQTVEFGHVAALTLVAATATKDGGMGIKMSVIGTILGVQGALHACLAPFGLRYLVGKMGNKHALLVLTSAWPISALAFPLATALARTSFLYPCVAILVILRVVGGTSWPITDMLLADRATPRLLATINACALISGASGRTTGPSLFGVSFGLSIAAAPGTFGRSAVWICLFLASLGPVIVVAALIEPPKSADIELAEDRQGLLAEE